MTKEKAIKILDSFVVFDNNHEEAIKMAIEALSNGVSSAQPTLHGYNIEHLELIARILQKENLPPERIIEVLTDISRIVTIVKDEFEESLRKAIEQCTM